jgi:hypothetical protein
MSSEVVSSIANNEKTMGNTRILIIAAALAVLTGCKKDEEVVVDLGLDYYPTAVGSWVEYQVDSLWRDDPSAVRDSVSYRLLERVAEAYTDDEGRSARRILRYVRDENDEWVVRDVWSSTANSAAAEMTEENVRRLKLSFPVRAGRTWDANIYNTEPELMVAYGTVDETVVLNGISYANTVLVKNTVPPNFVVKREFQERYARGVGMISKYREETNTQVVGGQLSVVGWRLNMTAVAHGTE